MTLRLSVLDQSPISQGQTGGDALRNSVDLARLADRAGYFRYWVAEHHGTSMLAGTSPEILIGPIAAATTHLRVGSGGVMLPHYSPLKVAETFSLLSALYPGRIDLAVGRAAGTDPVTAFALQRDRRQAGPDDFPEQLASSWPTCATACHARTGLPGSRRCLAIPSGRSRGCSVRRRKAGSGPLNAGCRTRLPISSFPAVRILRAGIARNSSPRPRSRHPYVMVCAWALCAETDEEAHRLAASSRMAFAHFLAGDPIRVPPVDTALDFLARRPDAMNAVSQRRRAIIGTPASVRERLEALRAEYEADEVMVVTITYDHDARKRSYELLVNGR